MSLIQFPRSSDSNHAVCCSIHELPHCLRSWLIWDSKYLWPFGEVIHESAMQCVVKPLWDWDCHLSYVLLPIMPVFKSLLRSHLSSYWDPRLPIEQMLSPLMTKMHLDWRVWFWPYIKNIRSLGNLWAFKAEVRVWQEVQRHHFSPCKATRIGSSCGLFIHWSGCKEQGSKTVNRSFLKIISGKGST